MIICDLLFETNNQIGAFCLALCHHFKAEKIDAKNIFKKCPEVFFLNVTFCQNNMFSFFRLEILCIARSPRPFPQPVLGQI